VIPKLIGGWQHNYTTKTRQVGLANEQSIFSPLSMVKVLVTKQLELSL
jgi:hypothetical protein